MAIYRVNKTKNYTTIGNYHLREKEMSLKAKGLLTLFLSLPDDWNFSAKGITSLTKESINTINKIMNELEEFGYLKRTRIYKDGRVIEWRYDIYEKSQKKLDHKNVDLENVDLKNCDDYKYTKQLNTKQLNTNKLNKEIYKERFLKFYELYPKKVKKKDTEKWFLKNKPDEELFNKIMEGLKKHLKSKQWKDKQYIPYPTTWLNGERWNDEVKIEETEEERIKRLEKEIEEAKKRGEW